MKKLKDIFPDAAEVLKADLEKLSEAVLHVVHSSPEPLKRKEIAKNLAEDYHPDLRDQVAHAIQEAVGFLGVQCLLGASPYDEDLAFITRAGREKVESSEHPSSVG